jgi:hypothetical protein
MANENFIRFSTEAAERDDATIGCGIDLYERQVGVRNTGSYSRMRTEKLVIQQMYETVEFVSVAHDAEGWVNGSYNQHPMPPCCSMP